MDKYYDAVVVGGGPAGLSAAIYMARAKYKVLVIEKENFGGQITITSEVVNYPGVLSTDGKKLTETMRIQAENFGAEFMLADVQEFDLEGSFKTIKTSKGEIKTIGLILATGASPRKIGFTGEQEFQGRGVAYCATCDGEFFTGMDIFVVGGGFAAAEEAVFLTKYGRKVTVIVREEDFTCAKTVSDEVKNHPGIEVHYETEVLEAGGDGKLQYAVFTNNKTGEIWRYEAEERKTFGMFVFAGYEPATGLFRDQLEVNEHGYLVTDSNQKTSKDGVYGAGDVCVKNLRQVVTAVSDGAVAATSLEKYVSGIYDSEGLQPREIENRTVVKPEPEKEPETGDNTTFIDAQMKRQLTGLFEQFTSDIKLKVYLDDRKVSEEVEYFVKEVADISSRIRYDLIREKKEGIEYYPSICVCSSEGEYRGIQFHGVPGGHEFNSFIIALYNAAGPGQKIDPVDEQRIRSIQKEINIKIFVSLSCTMCPELVMAAQKIAIDNGIIETEMFDLAHYPEIKEQYQIMSVPCMVVDDQAVHFGKKGISEILDILEA